jgi:nicotinamide-nucleotide amidase
MDALRRAENQSQLILITGGLGPTNDDVTKKTLTQFFGATYKLFPEVLNALKSYFDKRGIELSDRNRQLAEMPDNCIPVRNTLGTAWGMWFERAGKVFVSMPGVPAEMKAMMRESILPKLKQRFSLPVILHHHILTASVGESVLAEKLKEFETQLPSHFKLAYLPSLGFVKLRLTAKGNSMQELQMQMNEQLDKLEKPIKKHIYGYNDDIFEQVIGNILKEKKLKIATAESCTGGYIAHRITTVPGSSDYYMGSIISYSNEVKIKQLGVQEHTLQTHGAVSEETVKEMLSGLIDKLQVQVGIAVSGIAGPDGGTPEKPVGTVWIAVGRKENIYCRKVNLPGNRLQIIELTAVVALEMLRRYLLGWI